MVISNNFTHNGGTIEACEGRLVSIGEDCMFAGGVRISTTDHHSIVDVVSGERINKAKDVIVGNHVWLGRCVILHKGAVVADDSIVGECSIVNGKLSEPHALYVGTPARMIKQGITCARELR